MAITQAYMSSANKFGTMFMTPDGKSLQRNETPANLVPMVLAQGSPLASQGVTSPHDIPSQPAAGLNTR